MKPPKLIDLKAAKAARDRKRYAARVLQTFDDLKHADARELAEKRSETQRKARNKI